MIDRSNNARTHTHLFQHLDWKRCINEEETLTHKLFVDLERQVGLQSWTEHGHCPSDVPLIAVGFALVLGVKAVSRATLAHLLVDSCRL